MILERCALEYDMASIIGTKQFRHTAHVCLAGKLIISFLARAMISLSLLHRIILCALKYGSIFVSHSGYPCCLSVLKSVTHKMSTDFAAIEMCAMKFKFSVCSPLYSREFHSHLCVHALHAHGAPSNWRSIVWNRRFTIWKNAHVTHTFYIYIGG